MSSFDEFELKKISYSVEFEQMGDRQKATITPLIEVSSIKKQILIGDLAVDGHEMVPSAKIYLEPGENSKTFPSFKIIRQNYKGSDDKRNQYEYEMTLRLSPDGKEYHVDEQLFSF